MLCDCRQTLDGTVFFGIGLKLSDTEIENLHPIIGCDEQVFRLQVAMNDESIMGGCQALHDLKRVTGGIVRRDSLFIQPTPKRHALKQLRNDVGSRALKTNVVDRQNIGMVESSGRAGFLLETAKMVGIVA